ASIGAVGTRTSAASPARGPAAGAGLGGGTVSGTDGAVGASASCGEVAGPGSEPVSSSRRGGDGGPGGESPGGEMWQASHSISLSSRASGGGPTAPRTSRSRSIVIDGPGQVGHDAVGEGAAVLGVGVPAQVHGVEELVGGERPGRGAFEEAADEVLALVGEGPEVLADDRRQLRLVRRLPQLDGHAAPQERGRELPLAVAGHHDQGERVAADAPAVDGDAVAPPVGGPDLGGRVGPAGQLRDLVLALLEDGEEVVGQVDVALVDLVDQQDAGAAVGEQRGAEGAEADVAADVLLRRGVVASGGVEAGQGVVLVETVAQGRPAGDGPVQDGPEPQFVGH